MNTLSQQMPVKCHDPIDIGNVRINNHIARSSLAGITDGEFGEVLEPRIGSRKPLPRVGLASSSHRKCYKSPQRRKSRALNRMKCTQPAWLIFVTPCECMASLLKTNTTNARLILAGAICSSGNANACGSFDIASLNPPLFLFAFVATAITVAIFTGIIWFCLRFWIKPKSEVSAAFVAFLIVSVVLAAIGVFVVPQFQSLFAQFGGELPMTTSVLMSIRYLLSLPLVVLGVNVMAGTVRVSERAVYFRYLLAASITLAIVLWSLYAPIFKLC